MKTELSATLPMPPSANVYWRNFGGRMVVSKAAKEYKQAVGWTLKSCGKRFTGPVSVTIRVYRERKAGDLDNRIKVLLDAMTGVVYDDDSQIVEIHAYRYDDPKNPRVELNVENV